MTRNECKKYCIKLLKDNRGDDLERAEYAFQYMSPEEMSKEHGESGKSRQEILLGYREDRGKFTEALEWLKGVPNE